MSGAVDRASSTASSTVAGLGAHAVSGVLELAFQVEPDDRLVLRDQNSCLSHHASISPFRQKEKRPEAVSFRGAVARTP